MIKIQNEHLEQYAKEHYENLKDKLKDFPTDCKYSLEEVIRAKAEQLDEIAEWGKDKVEVYEFLISKYKNFTTKKDEYDAYDLAKKLNVNVCPYCNINSTYTVIKEDDKKITRPEFDHFYDKAKNPILALSFYNLIPSCHTCNSTLKGREEFSMKSHLNPYSDSLDEVAKFHLQIENSKFYHSTDGFVVKLETEDERAKKNIKIFELDTLYENHKDIVLELIQKEAIYNESYLDELMHQYEGTLFKNREDLQRLISGGYISDDEIGKRPLSKLVKDISDELGLR
ncbi:MAG: Unknown protein [uncultured Sulfurovum sp.]|uniref:HNH domain-containing protein n=1 Tax=uncultured Sulfurovum sp. TaxID=269237 RepID=A0A6S6TPL0_9BACT|nr:MAG: Unknown protein [uncultured Sulfurovum sp.]